MDADRASVLKVIHYEPAERARIRRALLRYMEENRIGVPKLQLLIVRANGYRDDELKNVSLKTLQRFVADQHRTNDTFVALCARFADDLPDDDPVADLGSALTTFMTGKAAAGGLTPFPSNVMGIYEATIGSNAPQADARHSILRVHRPLRNASFAAVEETIGPSRDGSGEPTAEGLWQAFDGVMFNPGSMFFALMRNALSGSPRTYHLTYSEGEAPARSWFRAIRAKRSGAAILHGIGQDGDDLTGSGAECTDGSVPIPVQVTFEKVDADAKPPKKGPVEAEFMPSSEEGLPVSASIEGPPDERLLDACHRSDTNAALAALGVGADVETVEPETGLSPIHIAIGTNNLSLTAHLHVLWGATIKPDGRGRWPSVIAARCRVGGDLCDYVVETEAELPG